jgi:hypothetical protein
MTEPINEQDISRALDTACADRQDGDAAALCAIATTYKLDQAQLCWWIRDIHSLRNWTPAALNAWCQKHKDLLEYVAGGNSLEL